MKVLLCGYKSFASQGLIDVLSTDSTIEISLFSRGKEQKIKNVISGDVFSMESNSYLQSNYDYVINYIYIKDGGIEENLAYLKSLVGFCKKNGIRRLLHISSISVYSNTEIYVNENTPIENNLLFKGPYASVKIACDEYLLQHSDANFQVTFIRPGYIISDQFTFRTGGILLNLPFKYGLLLGNNHTSLPLINRNVVNQAIKNILKSEKIQPVYLFLENKKGTKYDYVKRFTDCHIITLPKRLTLGLAKFLLYIHVFSISRYKQVEGLFKNTYFDSSVTESALNIKF